MPDITYITLTHGLDSQNYACTPMGQEREWAFPVGNATYPPADWYAATVHDPTGVLNNGYRHTGIDLNLDLYERGDVERRLGLAVYSMSDGYVSYLTQSWSGVPMLVIATSHYGKPLWIRYAHIIPTVELNEPVKAGQTLGAFANWERGVGGDHLHLDMSLLPIEREWLTDEPWVDPVPIMKKHLDSDKVQAMLKRQ